MNAPMLQTRGLDKRFGSLIVAQSIEIDLPQGARQSLVDDSVAFPGAQT